MLAASAKRLFGENAAIPTNMFWPDEERAAPVFVFCMHAYVRLRPSPLLLILL